jgi:hypothetical protein
MEYVVKLQSLHQVLFIQNSTFTFDIVNFRLQLLEKMEVIIIYLLIFSSLYFSSRDDFLFILFHYIQVDFIYFF